MILHMTTNMLFKARAEDLSIEDIPWQNTEFTMPSFEPPTHMKVLDLEVVSTIEFLNYPFLYTHTLKGAIIDKKLHAGM